MPKIVDVTRRRERIADAVFALIERGGVEAASLRNVASEAGLNVGSVRHYIDGHEGMLIEALQVMEERIEKRIWARVEDFQKEQLKNTKDSLKELSPKAERVIAASPAFRDMAVDVLEELLPLDATRRREVAVWLALSERSRTQKSLRTQAQEMIEGARIVTRPLVEYARVPEAELRAECLAVAVDGLAVALLYGPERLNAKTVREILHRHVDAALDAR
ncbi:TetR family transcriptional regulator C-terminal domain-containing protein [Dermatophilus congolensis]|uniref:TetR family transcriptional regulator C-terminal domain-containing protein n=1 Tax=Dermatophilus congolensis TaxID=1863 RepID=UPI001AAF3E59|nr:TetR family transcriptional regulator [Dermatophilus congolensis]MBO3152479.1 TetR family transcriptional regulator [Dermatophilus congolensis]MBO3160510.1 TetR family transcriptional regulator [Dermatophilus congolensis]MBO3163765.1 TetR family transcriptional regulator [Dermatophilus congolensis]MBO3177311.1 TetR family transcriptional regulator [Dermatophilus congolensis]